MIALAPWLMDLFRGGKFNRADATAITQLFTILAITLALWAVQESTPAPSTPPATPRRR